MKRNHAIAAIFLAFSPCFSNAMTGNELYAGLQDWRAKPTNDYVSAAVSVGYVQGVAEVADGLYFCAPSTGVTSGQVTDIVLLYLQNNPEKRNLNASTLIVSALQRVYPCKKGR